MPYDSNAIVKGGATILFNGQPVGYTKDALTIGLEEDRLRIDDVQQKVGVIDVRRTKASFVIKANLYEFTLESIRIAWGLSGSITNDTESNTKILKINVSGDYHSGELIIYGKGENNVNRTIKFYKVKLTERGDISLDAYGATIIPVTFQVLIHPSYSDLGEIVQDYVPSGTVVD